MEIAIISAHVTVSQPQDLYVVWSRGDKKIDTRKRSVDAQTSEAKFKDKFSMISGFKYDNKINQWLADYSTLTLFCEGKIVGTIKVDLISYIGQKSKVEKAVITGKNTEGKGFIGDHDTYPGAYLTFKIKVTP